MFKMILVTTNAEELFAVKMTQWVCVRQNKYE